MSTVIDVDRFFETSGLPTIDVRSPGEFKRGHIPGAHNVPLMDNAERAEIGTIYKRVGRLRAITRGMEIVGAKADGLVESIRSLVPARDLVVHCWRGGMRSEGFAWLLQQCGFKPQVLRGGYKSFRQAAHHCLGLSRRIIILGGHSGSGKTDLLAALREDGEQVIDLEQLAHHRGSAFGGINQPPQPTVEQFENELFFKWRDLDPDRTVWIEGESQSIGRVFIPIPVWQQMSAAPAIFVEADRGQRVEFLVKEYGHFPVNELAQAIVKIKKRLGGARLAAALEAIQRGDIHTFADIALDYYDKAYSNSLRARPRDHLITLQLSSPGQRAAVSRLKELAKELGVHTRTK